MFSKKIEPDRMYLGSRTPDASLGSHAFLRFAGYDIFIPNGILRLFRGFIFSTKNMQHFRKIETDRARLWSSIFELSLANSEAYICGRIEN